MQVERIAKRYGLRLMKELEPLTHLTPAEKIKQALERMQHFLRQHG